MMLSGERGTSVSVEWVFCHILCAIAILSFFTVSHFSLTGIVDKAPSSAESPSREQSPSISPNTKKREDYKIPRCVFSLFGRVELQ